MDHLQAVLIVGRSLLLHHRRNPPLAEVELLGLREGISSHHGVATEFLRLHFTEVPRCRRLRQAGLLQHRRIRRRRRLGVAGQAVLLHHRLLLEAQRHNRRPLLGVRGAQTRLRLHLLLSRWRHQVIILRGAVAEFRSLISWQRLRRLRLIKSLLDCSEWKRFVVRVIL